MVDLILIFLLCIGNQIYVDLIGHLSVSDLFIIGFGIVYVLVNRGLGKFANDKEIRLVTKLFALLLLIQVVTEVIVGNAMMNAAKGLAVTGLTYMKFLFVLGFLYRSHHNLLIFLICTFISNILFFASNDAFGLGEMDVSMEEMVQGEGDAMAYFKFKICPLINSGLVILTLVLRRGHFSIAFIVVGLLCVLLGARSGGMVMVGAGMLTLLLKVKLRFTKWRVLLGVVLGVLLFNWAYRKYVDSVLEGDIASGNSKAQLQRMDDPYNPLGLLVFGRTETFVGGVAMVEKPWTGWGAWAEDPNWQYNFLANYLQDARITRKKLQNTKIPTHSVLVGYGVANGVFAMLAVLAILFFFLRKGFVALRSKDIHMFLMATCLMAVVWDSLFSPISTMRYLFAYYFAYMYYVYKCSKNPYYMKLYAKE